MQSIRDWFLGLFEGASGIPGPLLTLLVILVVVAIVVIGLLVFGLPRLRRRRRLAAPLFDDHDRRDLAALRRAAKAAAEAGDWPLAIEERYRAIVRGVVDRDLVRVHPGTTARGVADAASVPFPAHARRAAVRRRRLRRGALPRAVGLARALRGAHEARGRAGGGDSRPRARRRGARMTNGAPVIEAPPSATPASATAEAVTPTLSAGPAPAPCLDRHRDRARDRRARRARRAGRRAAPRSRPRRRERRADRIEGARRRCSERHGVDVTEVRSAASRRRGGPLRARPCFLYDESGLLDEDRLEELADAADRLVVAEPAFGALEVLAPGVRLAGAASGTIDDVACDGRTGRAGRRALRRPAPAHDRRRGGRGRVGRAASATATSATRSPRARARRAATSRSSPPRPCSRTSTSTRRATPRS